MPITPVRRERPARRNANYRREPEAPKVFDPASDVSDLESDRSATTSIEEQSPKRRNKAIDDIYMLSAEEMDEEIEEGLLEEDQPEEIEEGDEDAEGEDEEEEEDDVEMDIETVDGSEIGDDEDVDEDDLEEEESDEETSDFEEPRKGRSSKSRQRQPQKSTVKQKSAREVSKKKNSLGEGSSLSKRADGIVLTKRQRAKLNEEYQHDLLQLPMEPTKKKHLTAEEIALKKSETARRRKHQSAQRAEQDKINTIDRLLKKQNTKRRNKEPDESENIGDNQKDGNRNSKHAPLNAFHWVNNLKAGSTLSVPIGYDIPIRFDKGPNYPPPLPICDLPGCDQSKKYRSVKNYQYACSMEHLKKIEGRA